jgi:hypothetical protein
VRQLAQAFVDDGDELVSSALVARAPALQETSDLGWGGSGHTSVCRLGIGERAGFPAYVFRADTASWNEPFRSAIPFQKGECRLSTRTGDKTMKRTALFAFLFAGLAACDTPTSAPTPEAPSVAGPSFALIVNERTDDVPIVGLFNPCPPQEFIEGTVDMHLVVTAVGDRLRVRMNISEAHGVGLTSGDRYIGHANRKFDGTISAEGETFEFVDHFRITREGSEDNFDFFAVFLITIPSEGEPSVELIRLRSEECRG